MNDINAKKEANLRAKRNESMRIMWGAWIGLVYYVQRREWN